MNKPLAKSPKNSGVTMQDRITVDDIAYDLGYKPGYVRDVVTKRPDFPKPYRIGNRMWWEPKEYQRWLRGLKG